jgi:alpha-ketoglutarate-dependent taurine dioxygenase
MANKNIHIAAKIEKYQLNTKQLKIFWGDGKESVFGVLWLRMFIRNADRFPLDSCEYVNSPLQEMPEETPILSIKKLDNTLHIDWGIEQEIFDGVWLRAKDKSLSSPDFGLSNKHFWDSSFSIPTRSYDEIMDSDDWIYDLNTYGIVLFDRGGPSNAEDKIRLVANKIGVLRRRNHPTDLNLFSAAPNSVALDKGYTSDHLAFHADAPYYGVPPKILYLCCSEVNEAHIPDNLFADSFKVCQDLREKYPDYYQTLSRVKVSYSRYRKTSHQENDPKLSAKYQWDTQTFAPVITTDEEGNPKTVRVHPRGYAGFESTTSEQDLRDFSEAYRVFHQMCHDDANAISLKLRPGMTVVQDNHRLIHARSKMSKDIQRKVFACYNDDYIWESKLRFLMRDKISLADRWLKGCTLKELERLASLT